MKRLISAEDFVPATRQAVFDALRPESKFRVDRAERYHCLPTSPSAYSRPLLSFYSAQTFGRVTEKDSKERGCVSLRNIVLCSAGVQLAHESTLPADDWMDQETSRRGQIPLYAHPEFGPEIAIMTSMGLLSRVYRMIAQTELPTKTKREIVCLLDDTAQEMSRGQELDRFPPSTITPELVIESSRRKTGALFGYAIEAGAVVVEATPMQRKLGRELGETAGIFYQLSDDLRDLSHDTSETQQRKGSGGVAVSLPAILPRAEVIAISEQYLSRIRTLVDELPKGKESPLGEFIGKFISQRS